eukprot:s4186_g3.t1
MNSKGKSSKGDGKSKTGGKQQNDAANFRGKGGRVDVCHRCGKPGHFARDCWAQTVRNVQFEGQQQPSPQATQSLQSCPSSTAGGSNSGAPQQSATQYRVARIHECDIEFQNSSDVSKHDELVFDLRSPASDASRHEGTIRVLRYYIGDEPECFASGSVRAVVEGIPDKSDMCNILLDSGADASVFPASMAGLGVQSDRPTSKLQDAQGNSIPVECMRDVELHLADTLGRSIVVRETVSVSHHIQQPIVCFGHLLENGWGINGVEQTLTHSSGVSIPIEMQNRSMTVRGWVRVIHEGPQVLEPLSIKAIKADVVPDLADMRVGWQLNPEGVGRGKHFAKCFQDPTLACPTMAGSKYRTTLVRDGGQWLVMELCEPLESLIDLSAEFHEIASERFVLTIITDAERPPEVMGFRLMDEGDEPLMPQGAAEDIDVAAPLAPEDADVVGVDIDGQQQVGADGMAIEGQLVRAPERGDHLVVNGVEIFNNTALATMREACRFYQISSSGGKQRCFQRLWDFQKKLELQTALMAAREAEASQLRLPRPQHLAEPPSEEEQLLHQLTHVPFKDWCPACVAHRSRQDRQMRDDSMKAGEIPTVSFDFAYTRAVAADGNPYNTDQVIALVMVDSQTNFTGCIPIKAKSQFDLMVREILQFTQVLGHVECVYLCDNEPSIKQVQQRAVRARLALGLPTRDKTPAAYSHGNSLCENTVGRVRSLAGSLMFRIQEKLSIELDTNSHLWTWAMRHASWILNRFAVVHGCTPYELVYSKPYKGKLAEFGEPVFAYTHTSHKGNPRWQRVLMLGKTEAQDTFVVFTGSGVMLSKSIRRIQTDWKSHLGFYLHFNAPTWQYKAGFGGRVVPTKRTVEPLAASDQLPSEPILPSMLHDADAEAVRQKAQEELKEEIEIQAMGHEDPMNKRESVFTGKSDGATVHQQLTEQPSSSAGVLTGPLAASGDNEEIDMTWLNDELSADDGQHVPVTPPALPMLPPSPRASPTIHVHDEGGDESHDAKKAKLDVQKKQRIGMLREEQEKVIRSVKIGNDEYYTLDEYEYEPQLESADDDFDADELWGDEDALQFSNVPDALWSSCPVDTVPGTPEPWIDRLADEIEINRLLGMDVLQKRCEFEGEISGVLTTRFVYDWRLKDYDMGPGEPKVKKWMRRSRYVAREFATDKRDDVYSPATGCHTSNLIPVLYLQMLKQLECSQLDNQQYAIVMSSLDIKDAFLQVPQEHVVAVTLHGTEYVVLRNLPGQRLGAKAWYWHFRNYVTDTMGFEWSSVQPCLAKCGNNVFMLHVDDLLFTGEQKFWSQTFLPLMQQKFSVSYNVLGSEGSEISFLKRRLVMLSDGMMIVPGTSAAKVIECFEKHFGAARVQRIPCDSSLQQEDNSQYLNSNDARNFRSVIGLLLYLSRDRVDLMFGVKELASAMSSPTLCSVQRLRKLVGYLKHSGDYAIKLPFPEHGAGKCKQGTETFWLLESYTDADWSSNKAHRRSTSCSIHFVNNCYVFGSSRSQKVISLSSAESELHSMVAGCCDGIFIKNCLQFLLGLDIQHHQYTDNSAARQLISRQGVGRIRHLSGKLLWMQNAVLKGDVLVHQVSTVWNFSDVGTKALSRVRLYFLLCGIGLVEAESAEPVGLEEYNSVVEQETNKKELSKLAKAIKQITLLMTAGLGPTSVEAAKIENDAMCFSEIEAVERDETFWTWFAIVLLLSLWIGFACFAWFSWKKLQNQVSECSNKIQEVTDGLTHCWNQVADEDGYIATQEQRIDRLADQVGNLESQLEEQSNLSSMDHEYIVGLHYAVVEFGGFLRFPFGMEARDFMSMTTQERANVVAHQAMGSEQYLHLVRQRAHVEPGDNTDVNMQNQEEAEEEEDEEMESEEQSEDEPVEPEATMQNPTMTFLLETMKTEHRLALERDERSDAARMQHLILNMLESIRGGINAAMVNDYKTRMIDLFLRLADVARGQHRRNSFQRRGSALVLFCHQHCVDIPGCLMRSLVRWLFLSLALAHEDMRVHGIAPTSLFTTLRSVWIQRSRRMEMKTFYISWEENGSLNSFELSVPSAAPASDLSCCVRDRLGLKATDPFYTTWEKGDHIAAVPLSASLPDASHLRLVLPLGRPSASEREERPAFREADPAGDRPTARLPQRECPTALLDPSEPPGDAAADPKALATDLANERTLLAWLRTGLAAIRTVFSFATLSGLTAGELAVDVGVTLVLSFSGLATLLLGWKRFLAVRNGCPGRRIAIGPLYSAFLVVAAICLLGSLWRQPKRLNHPPMPGEERLMTWSIQ